MRRELLKKKEVVEVDVKVKKKHYYYFLNPQIFNLLYCNKDLDNNLGEFCSKSQSYINDEKHMKIEENKETCL